jgi:serine/threonine-protein kinase HipA
VHRREVERMGAEASDSYSLLEAIGRELVGAIPLLPEGNAEVGDG